MIRDFRQFTLRIFWTVALASAVVLVAVVAIPQSLSKQARLQVLRSHVAQTAQLAASVVDGDLHRQLLDAANYTPALYERTLAPLVRFHSAAPDIFYVYTMVERGGRSYFVVDTAASDKLVTKRALRASAYMEPFEELESSDHGLAAADRGWANLRVSEFPARRVRHVSLRTHADLRQCRALQRFCRRRFRYRLLPGPGSKFSIYLHRHARGGAARRLAVSG
jgi:hypothetical protein